MRILIVGAGGHGQVVADILEAQRVAGDDVEVIGFVDDDPELEGQHRLGRPILGDVARIHADRLMMPSFWRWETTPIGPVWIRTCGVPEKNSLLQSTRQH
jgi:hypothetical protein